MKRDPNELGSLGLKKYPTGQVLKSQQSLLSNHDLQSDEFLKTKRGKEIENKLRGLGYDKDQFLQLSLSASGLVQFKTVLLWYIWYANEHSLQKATRALKKFDSNLYYSGLQSLWVTGIEVDTIVSLGQGYYLYPIFEMPLSYDREEFRSVRMNMYDFFNFPKAAIVKKTEILKAPIRSKNDTLDNPYIETISDNYKHILTVSRLLNLVPKITCLPYMMSFYPLDCPLCFAGGGGMSYTKYKVSGTSKIETNQISVVKRLVKSLHKRNQKERSLIEKSLGRLITAKQQESYENKFLDLAIALESVLLNSNTNYQQLALSFRLNGTLLLGGNYEERKKNYSILDEIYTHRSAVAHGGMLAQTKQRKYSKGTEKSLKELFSEFENLAIKIFVILIEKGIPDWKKLQLMGKYIT